MYKCDACHKHYSSEYNLKKHLQRQPLCESWMKLSPGIKDYVDDKFMLPLSDVEKQDLEHKCFICGTIFANLGNLNRHLDHSMICSKWSMYKELEPLQHYMQKKVKHMHLHNEAYETFETPAYSLCHIIWNLFIIDKDFAALPNFEDILKENKVKYILAILPDESEYTKHVKVEIDHHIMVYKGHTMSLDTDLFDEQIAVIEDYRKHRGNVFVFCNNGYQRSIPFLCYYLTKHHADEVPDIERAIDIILPQVDKANYASLRDEYVSKMKVLFNHI